MPLVTAGFYGLDRSQDSTRLGGMRGCLLCRSLLPCSRCVYHVLELLRILTRCSKASGSMELARTASKVALSLAPLLFVKNRRSRRWLQKDLPGMEEKRPAVLKTIRMRTILFHALIFTPILLFLATIIASLERTPLTGRYVVICFLRVLPGS